MEETKTTGQFLVALNFTFIALIPKRIIHNLLMPLIQYHCANVLQNHYKSDSHKDLKKSSLSIFLKNNLGSSIRNRSMMPLVYLRRVLHTIIARNLLML
jgi:hypothetical protein